MPDVTQPAGHCAGLFSSGQGHRDAAGLWRRVYGGARSCGGPGARGRPSLRALWWRQPSGEGAWEKTGFKQNPLEKGVSVGSGHPELRHRAGACTDDHSTDAENRGLKRAHAPCGLLPARSPPPPASHLPAESGSPRMEEARSNRRTWEVIVGWGREWSLKPLGEAARLECGPAPSRLPLQRRSPLPRGGKPRPSPGHTTPEGKTEPGSPRPVLGVGAPQGCAGRAAAL